MTSIKLPTKAATAVDQWLYGRALEKQIKRNALTIKQREFAEEWVRNGQNGLKAHIKAYTGTNMSDQDHRSAAAKLLKNKKVANYIMEIHNDLAAEIGVTTAWRLKTLYDQIEQAKIDNEHHAVARLLAELHKIIGTPPQFQKQEETGYTVTEVAIPSPHEIKQGENES